MHDTIINIEKSRFLLPGILKPYLDAFTTELSNNGYTMLTINDYYSSIAHFNMWLEIKKISLQEINNNVLEKFAKHKCHCPGGRKNNKVSCRYLKRVLRFICYLRQKKFLNSEKNISKAQPSSLIIKFKEFLHNIGLATATIKNHEFYISKLLPILGYNPKKYNPTLIRKVIYNSTKQCSIYKTKHIIQTLKAYLRFLTVEGKCQVNLGAAIPTVAHWKLSSLPKYITSKEVELIISSCNIHTACGLRDRAIILLLARLGLRAGDIINMLIDDINWRYGTLLVRGKGRTEVKLPLPQEVGDALLAYLTGARPQVTIKQMFLCHNAPYRCFKVSNSISSIVSAGLYRAGIADPPSHGANLLRHSAATAMLRNGATIEGVSAVLRHRSLDMTAYYAKVDINMLMQLAQPWPDGAPC